MTFEWKASFELLDGQTCLIIASRLQEQIHQPEGGRNNVGSMPRLLRTLHDIPQSFDRRDRIGFPEAPSFEQMHADAVCVGTDALAPGSLDQRAELFGRQPDRILFRRLLHPAHELSGFRPSAVESDQQALAWDSAVAGAVKWRELDLPHYRGQEDPSVRLDADRARRPSIRQDVEIQPHNRTIKQIDGLNASRPDLELVEEPQAQQRQDAKQVERAFCHKSPDGPSIDNTAVSSIAPGPVNPSEMPNSCGVVVGRGRAGLMLLLDVKCFWTGLGVGTRHGGDRP